MIVGNSAASGWLKMQTNRTAKLRFYDTHTTSDSFRFDVLDGLASKPKRIPPKYFYDERGSQLFDAICELAEYYPTRTEQGILSAHAAEIADNIGKECLFIELGSGSSQKVRLLLDALRPCAYMPLDISKDHLLRAAQAVADDYPWLAVHAACCDFSRTFELPYCPPGVQRVAFFPGSSLGNFEPLDALVLLRRIAKMVGPKGGLLIGLDLKKDPNILHAAYNDAQGVTAQFNLNLLARINRELHANFQLHQFEHRAFYNDVLGRVEMHLVSACHQQVTVGRYRFFFKEGESVHTENSYKYQSCEFQNLANRAGFNAVALWTDPQELFSVHYLVAR